MVVKKGATGFDDVMWEGEWEEKWIDKLQCCRGGAGGKLEQVGGGTRNDEARVLGFK